MAGGQTWPVLFLPGVRESGNLFLSFKNKHGPLFREFSRLPRKSPYRHAYFICKTLDKNTGWIFPLRLNLAT
jgi:hypothetical protein